jgi:hypothetical protein
MEFDWELASCLAAGKSPANRQAANSQKQSAQGRLPDREIVKDQESPLRSQESPISNIPNLSIQPSASSKAVRHSWRHFRLILVAVWLLQPGFALSQTPVAQPDWSGRLSALLADPVFGQQSNSGIDIVSFRGAIWIGSSRGVSFSPDSGKTWFTHNSGTGLLASNVSALAKISDTLWIATAKAQVFGNDTVNAGQGIQYTGDSVGDFWGVPLDTGGLLDSSTTGGNKVTFDIAGADTLLFTSSFAGGLIGSSDRGESWIRFNVTFADAQYFDNPIGSPPVTSLYFSAVVDTGHTDTSILWAGHAGGLSRFDFVEPHIKPSSSRVFDFAYSPAGFTDSGFIFIGGDRGLSRATALSYSQWKSVFAADGVGLPSDVINQLHFFGGWLFLGCLDSLDGDGVGFVRALPSLDFFQPVSDGVIDSVFTKPGARVMDFESVSSRYLYTAGASAGLFVSPDTGLSWTHIVTDTFPGFTSIEWASVNAVRADTAGDLWCGTDAGLMKLYIDGADFSGAVVDSVFHLPMVDETQVAAGTGSGASVRRIEIQRFIQQGTPTVVDSTVIWTANFPFDTSGEFSTYRVLPYTNPPSIDTIFFRTARIDQIMSRGTRVYFVGLDGVFEIQTSNAGLVLPEKIFTVKDTSRSPQVTIPISGARAIFAVGDTTHLGTERFFGVSTAPRIANSNWHVALANTQTFAADTLALYNSSNSGLSGNFVPVLDVQYRQGQAPIIWAATRLGDATDLVGGIGVSYLDLTTPPVDSLNPWVQLPGSSALAGIRVWNFDFNGDTIYAASDSGLFSSPAPDSEFVRVDLLSTNPDEQIRLGAAVNGVAVIDNELWVATDDGFARRLLSDVFFDVFKVNDTVTQEAYSYPVPFNPRRDGIVKFHYQVPDGANSASISVYDFAMNLVRRVSTDVSRVPGQIAHDLVASDKWDGTNGVGEVVAPGIYYFKVEFSNGDNTWGKVVVIP